MTYTVQQLITNAYTLSGVVARNLQTVTGDQIEDGFNLLNSLLAVQSGNQRLIPYYTQFDFTATVGQEMYFIPNLISIETFTFFIGPVRYSTIPAKRINYWGSGRINNINSLPFTWNLQRTFGGANLFIYYTPQQAFPLEIWGKFAIPECTSLTQDLSLTLDLFYIEFLRYGLTELICNEYNVTMQPQVYNRLNQMRAIIMELDPTDFSNVKMSSLGREIGYMYADATLGLGWRP